MRNPQRCGDVLPFGPREVALFQRFQALADHDGCHCVGIHHGAGPGILHAAKQTLPPRPNALSLLIGRVPLDRQQRPLDGAASEKRRPKRIYIREYPCRRQRCPRRRAARRPILDEWIGIPEVDQILDAQPHGPTIDRALEPDEPSLRVDNRLDRCRQKIAQLAQPPTSVPSLLEVRIAPDRQRRLDQPENVARARQKADPVLPVARAVDLRLASQNHKRHVGDGIGAQIDATEQPRHGSVQLRHVA